MRNAVFVLSRLLGIALVVAGVYLGAKAYKPAQSGAGRGLLSDRGGPWSQGASVDPKLAAGSAGCLVTAAVLLIKRPPPR